MEVAQGVAQADGWRHVGVHVLVFVEHLAVQHRVASLPVALQLDPEPFQPVHERARVEPLLARLVALVRPLDGLPALAALGVEHGLLAAVEAPVVQLRDGAAPDPIAVVADPTRELLVERDAVALDHRH